MKIQSQISQKENYFNPTRLGDIIRESEIYNSKKETFKNVMQSSVINSLNVELKDLIEKIDKQKEQLIKNTSILEFKKYKDILGQIINTINKGMEIKEFIFVDSFGRQKNLQNIKCINNNLKEISLEFINDNVDSVKIINLVEDIRGLVVDMYI